MHCLSDGVSLACGCQTIVFEHDGGVPYHV